MTSDSDLFNSRKNVTLEVLSHDASGAFIMVEQLAQYLRDELPEGEGSVFTVDSPLAEGVASRLPEELVAAVVCH